MIRRQLTLFLDKKDSEGIELIRQKYNPEQSELIKSHVTLCREDEIEDIGKILTNLRNLTNNPISLKFGEVLRFSNGNGVLMPASGENFEFHELRKHILNGINKNPRKHEPHITLMHPRNSTCTDQIFEEIKQIKLPKRLIFNKISLIEQEMGLKWRLLEEFDLNTQ